MGDTKPDRIKVLVLDDDGLNRDLTQRMLALRGAEAVVASNIDDALRELRNSPPVHLVVTDISLGGKGQDRAGIGFAQSVRAANPDLPIMGYSAFVDTSDLSVAERAAFTDYFPRGGSIAEVGHSLARCLEEGIRYRERRQRAVYQPVSYTHLTLPTICSV